MVPSCDAKINKVPPIPMWAHRDSLRIRFPICSRVHAGIGKVWSDTRIRLNFSPLRSNYQIWFDGTSFKCYHVSSHAWSYTDNGSSLVLDLFRCKFWFSPCQALYTTIGKVCQSILWPNCTEIMSCFRDSWYCPKHESNDFLSYAQNEFWIPLHVRDMFGDFWGRFWHMIGNCLVLCSEVVWSLLEGLGSWTSTYLLYITQQQLATYNRIVNHTVALWRVAIVSFPLKASICPRGSGKLFPTHTITVKQAWSSTTMKRMNHANHPSAEENQDDSVLLSFFNYMFLVLNFVVASCSYALFMLVTRPAPL